MELVSGRDGLEYGIGLLGWVTLVLVVGGGIAGVGWVLAGSGAGPAGRVLGGLIFLVGGIVILSGMLGLLYKVISDATGRPQ